MFQPHRLTILAAPAKTWANARVTNVALKGMAMRKEGG